MLVDREGSEFAAWWPRLQAELADTERAGEDWTMLTYGSEVGLLSTKVARAFPNALVVAVKRSRAGVSPHLSLLELLNIRNTIVCRARV